MTLKPFWCACHEVRRSAHQYLNVISGMTEYAVAVLAEKAANRPGVVVMVNTRNRCRISADHIDALVADRAAAVLILEHLDEVADAQSVMAIQRNRTLLAYGRAPELVFATRRESVPAYVAGHRRPHISLRGEVSFGFTLSAAARYLCPVEGIESRPTDYAVLLG